MKRIVDMTGYLSPGAERYRKKILMPQGQYKPNSVTPHL